MSGFAEKISASSNSDKVVSDAAKPKTDEGKEDEFAGLPEEEEEFDDDEDGSDDGSDDDTDDDDSDDDDDMVNELKNASKGINKRALEDGDDEEVQIVEESFEELDKDNIIPRGKRRSAMASGFETGFFGKPAGFGRR